MGYYKLVVIPNSYIISEIGMRHHTVETRERCKKMPLYQLPRSGWPVGRAGLGAKATYPA